MRVLAKELIRGAFIAVVTAACFFAAFVAAALWLPQDREAVRRHVVAAIEDGTFNKQFGYGPFGTFVWPRHTMDCALGSMLIAPPAAPLVEAMSNRMPAVNESWHDARVPETLDCQALARAVPELGPGYGDVKWRPVDRYLMGVRIFARSLLSMMPLEPAARVMRGIAFALLAALGLLALWKLNHASGASRIFTAGYLVIAGCLALLYGVQFFDATLFFAPLDYTNFAFILISLVLPLAAMRTQGLALYAASYGSLIAIFDTLTGGIPFALAMLPLMLALGFEGTLRIYFGKLVQLWAAFCLAVLVCFLVKRAFTAAFLSNEESFLYFLFYRMYGELPAASGTKMTLGYLFTVYRSWSRLIALGSANVGTGLILAALTIFIVQTLRIKKLSPPERPLLLACWLGVAIFIVWAAVFLNHTAVHPYMNARVFVVQVIGAALLVMMHLAKRQPAPVGTTSTAVAS